jgi:hypothetical protein
MRVSKESNEALKKQKVQNEDLKRVDGALKKQKIQNEDLKRVE